MSDTDLCVLTSATDAIEAGSLRAYLVDNGIHVYIQGELHGAMLGQFGGAAAIQPSIMVPRHQLEQARELLVAFRHGEVIDDEPVQDTADEEDADEALSVDVVAEKHDLRRVTMMAFFGFGMAHFAAGARYRAFLLLLMFIGAAPLTVKWHIYAISLMPLSMLFDLIGARAVVKKRHRGALPRAQAL